MPSLIVVGKKDQSELALDTSVTVIGRDRGVTLELSDFQVSRRHALVVRTDTGVFVKDLGSRNGVLVNSARVPSRRHQKLKNGNVLTLGRTALVFKEVDGVLDPSIVATIAARPVPPATPAKAPAPAASPAKAPAPAASPAKAPAAPAAPAAPEAVAKTPAGLPPGLLVVTPATPEPGSIPAPAPLAAGRARFVELAADADGSPQARPNNNANNNDPAVRALLRRLEVERIFYRNLALALVTFLMVLVLLLLVFALRRNEKASESAGQVTRPANDSVADARTGGSVLVRPQEPTSIPVPKAGQLDEREFGDTILPLLKKSCATGGCHASPAKGAGDLVLEAGDGAPALARNLASVSRFVVAGRPERSPLLTKPLRRDEGGEGHGGGDVLEAEKPVYQTIRAWISRAAPPPELAVGPPRIPARTLTPEIDARIDPAPDAQGSGGAGKTKHKPLARIAPVAGSSAVGATVVLDGRMSVCPTANCPLKYRWTLEAGPQGSHSTLVGDKDAQASLIPDVTGSYTLSLVVSDEDASSEPVLAHLTATLSPVAAPRALLSEAADGRAWARAVWIDLLGRGPTREESDRALGRTREELVNDLFGRDEPYAEWLETECLALGLIDEARPPSDVLSDLAGRLRRHEGTAAEALETLASSQGLAQRGDNEKVVLTLLATLLGQDKPEPALVDAARRMVDGQSSALLGKTGRSLQDLAKILVGDKAFVDQLARGTWLRLTGLPLDADGLEHARKRLTDGGAKGDAAPTAGFFDLLREWCLSPRYLERGSSRRTKSERAFVRTLFQDVIGRTPDEEELRASRRSMRTLADKTPLRAALAKVLLDSPQSRVSLGGDAETFVRSQFQQLLGREPREKELTAFVKGLGSGTSRDGVVRAILTSPEYAAY